VWSEPPGPGVRTLCVAGSLLDRLMDWTVVPGYTRAGYGARRALGRISPDLPSMEGRTVLVTGASSGLGLAACTGFARLGADVHMLARNAERAERARARVEGVARGGRISVELADLSDLGSVRSFAGRYLREQAPLHVLVNNAGVLPSERTTTPDGIELTLATNVIGPFLLTNLLVPRLVDSAPARIVGVSSGGMYTQRLRVDDLQLEREEFDGTRAYARTKRAEVVLTEMWAERLRSSGVVAHSMHPGWADTPGLDASLPGFRKLMGPLLRDPAQGADTIVWLGAADQPARSSGLFWHDRRARPTHRVPWTRETDEDRRRLWAECERLSGTTASV
jgi:dehydrogenase/reductase SDR family member 12